MKCRMVESDFFDERVIVTEAILLSPSSPAKGAQNSPICSQRTLSAYRSANPVVRALLPVESNNLSWAGVPVLRFASFPISIEPKGF